MGQSGHTSRAAVTMADAPLTVYTLPPRPPNFDAVGVFYVAFCAAWTLLVLAGAAFLCRHRRLPMLRVRGLPYLFAAVAMLHAYWMMGQVVYPLGRAVPSVVLAYDVQYFFMGLWFPLGIAVFHGFNTRFLHVARLQRRYGTNQQGGGGASGMGGMGPWGRSLRPGCNGAATSWLCRLRNTDYEARLLAGIGLAMCVQVLLTVGMWLACKKYHPTYGMPGTGLHGDLEQQLTDLGRGWEWWPSVLWQVIWTWMVAPFLLARAWDIRDTLGWRTQTIGCCLSGLHATPLFLAASYSPAFARVNVYFAPSEWIHLSTMMFEIFTIFVPCWQVLQHLRLGRRARASNDKWEVASSASTGRARSMVSAGVFGAGAGGTIEWRPATGSVSVEKATAAAAPQEFSSFDFANRDGGGGGDDEYPGDRLLTMSALDHVLADNPGPLQDFSAMRDFSGENVAFLTRVAAWKQALPLELDEEELRCAFTRALEIYTDFVSPRDAEFPVNLSSQDLKQLESIFERPARILCGEPEVDPATPFDERAGEPVLPTTSSLTDSDDTRVSPPSPLSPSGGRPRFRIGDYASRVQYAGEISPEFDADVFDSAQAHVKYLVFTNTWPKFVSETQREQRRRSGESERSDRTGSSNTSSLASRCLAQTYLARRFVALLFRATACQGLPPLPSLPRRKAYLLLTSVADAA
ncbi:hypothetical protein GGR56DRAFT_696875 [Xylariaceae sp. FL0804]|nr:hypothetical protein GGR56DRAFT_696875 [Xylariaceae sp. FL0804]